MKLQLTRISSLLLTGMIAGVFFYGQYCVLPTFYDVSTPVHLQFRTALMNHNKVIVMGITVLSLIAMLFYCRQVRQIRIGRLFCWAALILTVISLLITRLGSVPINLEIKTWLPASPPANFRALLDRWDLLNTIRTFFSLGSFLCLLIADLWLVSNKPLT